MSHSTRPEGRQGVKSGSGGAAGASGGGAGGGQRRLQRAQHEAQLRKAKRDRDAAAKRVVYDAELSEADALEMTGMDEDERESLVSDEEVQQQVTELLHQVHHGEEKAAALRRLKFLFGRGSRYVEAFLRQDKAMETLLGLLSKQATQLDTCLCITNIAASTHEHTVQAARAAPYLLQYMSSPSSLLQAQAAWAIGNIAADSVELRDQMLAQGAVAALLPLAQGDKEADVAQQAWFALSQCVRGPGAPVIAICKQGLLSQALHCLAAYASDPAVLAEICWTLTFVTALHNKRRRAGEADDEYLLHRALLSELADGSTLPILLELLQQGLTATWASHEVLPVLRCLGNFVAADEGYATTILQHGNLIAMLIALLNAPQPALRLETLWLVSNIAAGPADHAATVVTGGFLPVLREMLAGPADFKREAAICALNVLDHGPEAAQHVAAAELVQPMLALLKCPEVELIIRGLQFTDLICRHLPEARKIVLEEYADLLEGMQYNDPPEVASRASHIVDTYLDIEEDEELPEGVQAPGSDSLGNAAFGLPGAPVTGGGGFSF